MTSPRPGVGTGRKVPCGGVRVKHGKNLVGFFFSFFLCSYLEGESQVQAFSLVNLAFGVNTQYVWSTVSWGALRDLDCFEDQPGGGLPRPSILLLRALGDYLPDGFSPAILCLLLPLL